MSDLFGHVTQLKALSLWQPWASLTAMGVRADETRDWSTDYRGPVAIHAAKTLDVVGAPQELCTAALGPMWRKTVPLGCVVAIAELTACREASRLKDLTKANLAAGNFAPGRFAWRFDKVRKLREPIPLVGRQGLFNWTPPDDLGAQLVGAPINHEAACRYIGWL